jgi:hypothetical protein
VKRGTGILVVALLIAVPLGVGPTEGLAGEFNPQPEPPGRVAPLPPGSAQPQTQDGVAQRLASIDKGLHALQTQLSAVLAEPWDQDVPGPDPRLAQLRLIRDAAQAMVNAADRRLR